MNKYILRLEGLLFLLTALYFYRLLEGSWILFIVLLFTPDISLLGYFINKRVGAVIYNSVHNYALALLVIAAGIFIKNNLLSLIGLILFAHVAMDRMLGFGLRYPADPKATHLQKI